jgi:NAD(P)-dependent dehydrogenase (short-subunit alcohol dehydrogenase family)
MSAPTAIVTGGAHRLGKGIALCLAEMGYHIVLHYGSSAKDANDTRKLIELKGVKCQTISLDLAMANAGPALFDQIDPLFDIEILVNSASIFQPSDFDDESEESLVRHFNINFRSPYSLSKTFFHRYDRGQIINILDTKISQNKTDHLDYLISKKALEDFTKLSATSCGPHFRVNGIAPGLILPPEGKDQSYLDEKALHIPLQTTGDINQIQNAVRYLVENPFLTGQILYIDGGEHL